ncbi:non-ribosomal peptide synthetase [Micromonospora sp. CPCC 205561]|uniref:non-ribosomal peptide synthetase n=1 Tax=Micromonospora sp. CPCC 205561 TaxID=3122407 RepID=UPI002FF163B5
MTETTGAPTSRTGSAPTSATTAGAAAIPDVVGLIERCAAGTPDAVAVTMGDAHLTYRQLDRRADGLARRLRDLGVGPGRIVGLHADRSPELIVGLLAVLKSGGAYLPLDPALPDDRLRFMVDDAAASIVLTRPGRHGPMTGGSYDLVSLHEDGDGDGDGTRLGAPAGAGPRDLAYVMYTSGSTGRPKGVMVERQGLANYVRWLTAEFSPGRPVHSLLHTSIAFDFSATNIYLPLVTGGSLALAPPDADHEALARLLQDSRLDLVRVTPSHAELLDAATGGRTPPPGPRYVVVGGEILRAHQVSTLRRLFPGSVVYNHYGPTETVIGRCFLRLDESAGFHLDDYAAHDPVPVGGPIPNTRLTVRPREPEETADDTGELLIGGLGLARGYLNLPALTERSFVTLPDGTRAYRTGDLVRLDDRRRLVVVGRADDQVKIRGHRVELGEVEACLRASDEVRAAAVVKVASPGDALVAFVVPERDGHPDPAALRAALARRLPNYMLPHRFVVLDALPLSANRKLDRAALAALAVAPAPRPVAEPSDPRPESREERFLRCVRDVLGLSDLSADDDFLALGGDSIAAMKLAARCRAIGIELRYTQILVARSLGETLDGATR